MLFGQSYSCVKQTYNIPVAHALVHGWIVKKKKKLHTFEMFCFLFAGLCPRRNHTNPGSSNHSTVANLMPLPSLFDALTETDNTIDPRIKWTVSRISHEEEDISHYKKAPSSVDKYNGEFYFTLDVHWNFVSELSKHFLSSCVVFLAYNVLAR